MAEVILEESARYETLEKFLESDYVLICLDPRSEDVSLPSHLKDQPIVTLKISRFFVKELLLTPEKIEASLLFHGSYLPCIIPLGAIWEASTPEGSVAYWTEKMPPNILASLETRNIKKDEPVKAEAPKKVSHLTRVK